MADAPPGWMVRLNVALLRRGVKVGSQHLLSVPGRKSGIERNTPVSIVIVGDSRYIVAAFAEADWVKNARAAGAGSLGRGRHVEPVGLVELPESERGPVVRAFLEQVPGGRRFFDSPDAEAVVASAGRYPVFRVTPTTLPAVSSLT